jgi:hypothetical protein
MSTILSVQFIDIKYIHSFPATLTTTHFQQNFHPLKQKLYGLHSNSQFCLCPFLVTSILLCHCEFA